MPSSNNLNESLLSSNKDPRNEDMDRSRSLENLPLNLITCIHTKPELHDFLKTYASNPIVIYVTATWCGPCKKSYPHILNILKNRKDIMCIKLDYDNDRSAVSTMKVRSVPSLYYIRNNSKENVCFSSSESDIDAFFNDIYI